MSLFHVLSFRKFATCSKAVPPLADYALNMTLLPWRNRAFRRKERARSLPETPEESAEPLPRRESFFLPFLLQTAEGQLTLPMRDKRARKWTVAELHAHCRRKAADKKRLRAEETSERLKALYAVAPRIGPDGKPLPPANHTKRDGAKTGPQATRSRPSRAMAPPTSTPPPPDQAPATPTAAAGKVSSYDIARIVLTGLLTAKSRLKVRSNQLQDQPVVSATTARPLDFVADLRTSSTSTAIAQQDQQVSTGSSASTSPLPGTAESHLGGFDASFSNDNISPTLTGIEAGIDLAGSGQSRFRANVQEGVDIAIDCGNAVEESLGDLLGGQLAGVNLAGELGGG